MKFANINKHRKDSINSLGSEGITSLKGASKGAKRRGFKRYIVGGSVLTIIIFTSILVGAFIKNPLQPIRIIGGTQEIDLKETDGRTNVLLLGSDRRSNNPNVTSELTDTIIVASISKFDKDIVMISLPRDLWIPGPYAKINEIYAYSYDPKTGTYDIEEVKNTVEAVLGIPIHYHAKVTFDLFEKVVDTIDGVNVPVEHSFTDYYYPIEGMENAENIAARYETLHFEAGLQKMDGPNALKFVRSRKGDNNEGTDFARAKRQQLVIKAIKDKVLSTQTLLNIGKLKELYELYKENVETNIDWDATQNFALLATQVEFNEIRSVVLDDRSDADHGGLLFAPEDRKLYGERYVLLPKTGDYSQIHAYVQKYLFSKQETQNP